MRKTKIILSTILIVLFTVLSVSTLCVYANSQEKTEGIFLDDNLQDSQKIIKEKAINKNIQLDDENINLTYAYSITNSEKELDMYLDNNDNTEYIFDGNDVVGFIKDVNLSSINVVNSASTESVKTQGQILNIGIEYLSKAIENFEEYELVSINYISSYNEYAITYMNKCSGYNTSDTAQINITPVGEIVSFCANNQGMMKEYEDSNILIDQMQNNAFIEETLNTEFENIDKYEIEDKILTKVDGKLAMQYYIALEYENNDYDSAVIICYVD